MHNEILFQVSAVSCEHEQQSLFAPVTFTLNAGEVLLLEGANGSGKSSLLRILCGLATPAAGEVRWKGKLIADVRDEYVDEMHYVGHQNGLKLGLTATENLALLSCQQGLLAMTAPHINIPTKLLSAGQKRKLALQKLFLFPKKLWLLDEPLTALDVDAQTLFFSKLEEHLQHGGMCIISSHHPLSFKHASVKTLRLAPC